MILRSRLCLFFLTIFKFDSFAFMHLYRKSLKIVFEGLMSLCFALMALDLLTVYIQKYCP